MGDTEVQRGDNPGQAHPGASVARGGGVVALVRAYQDARRAYKNWFDC